MLRDRPEPLIYAAWMDRLEQALVMDRLGPAAAGIAKEFRGLRPDLMQRLLERLRGQPDGAAAAETMLRTTLSATLDALGAAYGANMEAWRWGDAHPAALTSQLFGRIPLLGKLFDTGLPASGGDETVNRAGYVPGDGVHYPDVHGPGYRAVYDLADLESSRMIIATGQSGSPFSPHYGDLAQRWETGDALQLRGTEDELAQTGLGRIGFTP
jgi:penicillin amidase